MPELDVSALLSVQRAIEIIDAAAVSSRMETVELSQAQGRRLAEDIYADRDYPPFNKSLMDGFALRSADAVEAPTELEVVGEIAAGQASEISLGAHQAVAIMTGAPLPRGADAVVPVEDTRVTNSRVYVARPVKAGAAMAPRASDCPAGSVVLSRGTVLQAAQLAVAASVGAAQVSVFARPRVAVLSTGNELVTVSQTPAAAQIRNSNNIMLAALLRRFGCEVADLGTVVDEPQAVRAALERGLAYDALAVTGGMSMGTYDYVPRRLADLEVELRITKVRIKPGKPFVFGVKARGADRSSFVFGLPGNPLSAFVCMVRLASRLLSRMGGGAPDESRIAGSLRGSLPANGPREFYLPVRIERTNSETSVMPLAWKGSADLFTLALADGLLVRAENEGPLPEGSAVQVMPI